MEWILILRVLPNPYAYGGPEINKIVVLDLTRETEETLNWYRDLPPDA